MSTTTEKTTETPLLDAVNSVIEAHDRHGNGREWFNLADLIALARKAKLD